MRQEPKTLYDLIGVGVGPSNLSLAALLSPVKQLKRCFLEQKEEFTWHPGMLMDEATLQVSFIKDLVSLVDPTNPHSFLSFLVEKKRIYRYLNAQFAQTKRVEFNQYYQWASQKLENLHFDSCVEHIEAKEDFFLVKTKKEKLTTKSIVLGTGLTPKFPPCSEQFIKDKNIFHAINFLLEERDFKNKTVAVIGGGQSGAEMVNHLLNQKEGPSEINWITGRIGFQPIDDTNFTNEFFTPDYSEYFQVLSSEEKKEVVKKQNLWSDGIEAHLLGSIYQKAYELEFLQGSKRVLNLFPENMVEGMYKNGQGYEIVSQTPLQKNVTKADAIVMATGFSYTLPKFLEGLKEHIVLEEGRYIVNDDFSIQTTGLSSELKIFVQNASRFQRGIADPNLSLMAWRSAKIINSLLGEDFYDLVYNNSIFNWKKEPVVHQSQTI